MNNPLYPHPLDTVHYASPHHGHMPETTSIVPRRALRTVLGTYIREPRIGRPAEPKRAMSVKQVAFHDLAARVGHASDGKAGVL